MAIDGYKEGLQGLIGRASQTFINNAYPPEPAVRESRSIESILDRVRRCNGTAELLSDNLETIICRVLKGPAVSEQIDKQKEVEMPEMEQLRYAVYFLEQILDRLSQQVVVLETL